MSINQSKSLGVLLAFFGVVLFSAKAVLVKLAYQYSVDSVSLLLLRMIFALPFYILIASIQSRKKHVKQSNRNWLWLIVFGVVGYYLASLFDFMGLTYIKAGLERLILFVYPTLVLIFSKFFLKTRITKVQLIAIVVTCTGLVTAFYQEMTIDNDEVLFGALLIFISAVCYAGYLVGSSWLIPKFGAIVFTSYVMIVSCVCVIIHYLLTNDFNLTSYSADVYWISLAMAILCTVMPSYLVSWAIKIIGAPSFSIMGSFGPVSTIFLAYIFLDEHISMM